MGRSRVVNTPERSVSSWGLSRIFVLLAFSAFGYLAGSSLKVQPESPENLTTLVAQLASVKKALELRKSEIADVTAELSGTRARAVKLEREIGALKTRAAKREDQLEGQLAEAAQKADSLSRDNKNLRAELLDLREQQKNSIRSSSTISQRTVGVCRELAVKFWVSDACKNIFPGYPEEGWDQRY